MSLVVTILKRGKEEHGNFAVRFVFVDCNNAEFRDFLFVFGFCNFVPIE